jgi:hypothetical protein
LSATPAVIADGRAKRNHDIRNHDKVGAPGQVRLIPLLIRHGDISHVSSRTVNLAVLQPLSRRFEG